MQIFSWETKIFAGAGALSILSGQHIRRLYLIADPWFRENKEAERLIGLANPEAVEVFSDIKPDPTLTLTASVTAKIKTFQPDTVVALGGGSTMDLAKAAVFFSGLDIALIAVPTTSGSGSEVTDFAILTHNGVKHPLVDERLRPKLAILDSDLLMRLPPSLIADTGFDVVTHALESWVAKNAGAVSDSLALSAFASAYGGLVASFAGDTSQRLKLHLASTMAGVAFSNAGLGLCHALSHSLGALVHLPHGRLNAMLLPHVIELNSNAAGEKYGKLSQLAGLGGSRQLGARNLKNAILRLRRDLKLPATLAEAGIDPQTIDRHREQIVEAALADPCCATNPLTVEPFMVRRLLESIKGWS